MEPKAGDLVFVDTNILLAATDRCRPSHRDAGLVLASAGSAGLHLAISGQVQREYLVVATRPVAGNGLGLTGADALANIERILSRTVFFEESRPVADRLRSLVRAGGLTGVCIHDANIVATMRVHGIAFLLTLNAVDFQSFPDIRLVDLAAFARRLEDGTQSPA